MIKWLMLILFLCPLAFSEYIDMLDPRFKLPADKNLVFKDSKDPRTILQQLDGNFNLKSQDSKDLRIREYQFINQNIQPIAWADTNWQTSYSLLDLNLSNYYLKTVTAPLTLPALSDGKYLKNSGGALQWADVTATPAGDKNQIQFNNGGVLGADENLQWRTYANGGLLASGQLLFYGPNINNGRVIPVLTETKSYFYFHPYLNTLRIGLLFPQTFTDTNLNYGGVIIGGGSSVGGTSNINIGSSSSTNGNNAINLGNNNVIRNSPDSGLTIGNFNDLNSTFGIAIGISNKTYNGRNVAIGYSSQATGSQSSVAIGTSTASAINAVALGNSTASGQNSTSVGQGNASGTASFAGGTGAEATGQYSFSYGPSSNTIASGTSSFAFGSFVRTYSDYSVAFGLRNDANATAMAVFGLYAPQYSGFSQTGIEPNSPLFIIGNGTAPTARKAAFAIRKDGNTSIGYNDGNATRRLDVNAVNGSIRLAGDLNVVSHQNDATPNLYIKQNDGNVGINTKSPSKTLDVNGDINTKDNYYIKGTMGLTITLGYTNDKNYTCWADYNSGLLTRITGAGCP